MGTKIIAEVELATIICLTCGIIYAMPVELLSSHELNGNTHYCPSGHGQMFCAPEKEKGK